MTAECTGIDLSITLAAISRKLRCGLARAWPSNIFNALLSLKTVISVHPDHIKENKAGIVSTDVGIIITKRRGLLDQG